MRTLIATCVGFRGQQYACHVGRRNATNPFLFHGTTNFVRICPLSFFLCYEPWWLGWRLDGCLAFFAAFCSHMMVPSRRWLLIALCVVRLRHPSSCFTIQSGSAGLIYLQSETTKNCDLIRVGPSASKRYNVPAYFARTSISSSSPNNCEHFGKNPSNMDAVQFWQMNACGRTAVQAFVCVRLCGRAFVLMSGCASMAVPRSRCLPAHSHVCLRQM